MTTLLDPKALDSIGQSLDSPVSPLVVRLHNEGLIGAAEAARVYVGPHGIPPHPVTLMRWHTRGAKTPDGRTVRLEGLLVNGRLKTSRAAVLRFLSAQQPAEVIG